MLSRITDEDLARWEALVQEVMRASPYSTEFAVASGDLATEAVPALVAEVRRLRRWEAWLARLVAFERAATVSPDDLTVQAIYNARRILLREMQPMREEEIP